jgi:hypothetical protein
MQEIVSGRETCILDHARRGHDIGHQSPGFQDRANRLKGGRLGIV